MKRRWLLRIGAIVLTSTQLLSLLGCTREEPQTFSELVNSSTSNKEALKVTETGSIMQLSALPEKYIADYNYKDITCVPQVEQMPVADDFSNVINFDQFEGFTSNQLQMLKEMAL